jgi:SNF2 family DNA or RNA helicase
MEFKTKPFHHQLTELEHSYRKPSWGLFWEQGTGKTKPIIDTACRLWEEGEIDAALVVAPNGVHRNWVEQELLLHLPDCVRESVRSMHYQSSKSSAQWHQKAVKELTRHEGFSWLTISYEAFMTKQGHKDLVEFFYRRKLLYVLDEAHAVKEPSAKRTKSILKSAKYAPYRRILTGTPITQGPFDVYTQVTFLDSHFWEEHGFGSYTEFKHHFGVFTTTWNPVAFDPATGYRSGRNVEILKEYQRLDELHGLLKLVSSRVTKDEVLDLPPKLYAKRFFTMNDEQSRLYRELRDEYITWLTLHPEEAEAVDCGVCSGLRERVVDGMAYPCEACAGRATGDTLVATPLAMVRLLRLQQVTCGYLPTEDESEPIYMIKGPNHRLEEALDLCEEAQHKVIVWGRFQLDLTLLAKGLEERGIKAVRYDGMVGDDDRAEAKARFTGLRPHYEHGQVVGLDEVPEQEQAKVFLSNPAVGATGLTLTQARTVIYYSNSFKLNDRLQSEDRAHRIGQTNQVLYVDLVAEQTVDEKIVTNLREKKSIADQILGDKPKEWL